MPETAQAGKATADRGIVVPSFARGSAIAIRERDGRLFRLSWEDDAPAERGRRLEPGRYTVRSYRVFRTAKDGKKWLASALAPSIRTFTVEAGRSSELRLDEAVVFRSGVRTTGLKADVMMELQGENGSGLTLYREGKRIPIAFRLLDSETTVGTGTMTYG